MIFGAGIIISVLPALIEIRRKKSELKTVDVLQEKINYEGENYMSYGMSIGMCFGFSMGTLFTNVFGIMAISYGICFGMLIGMVIGMNIKSK